AQLRLTTRDVDDYDELMRMRLEILRRHGLRLADIQAVIAEMDVLSGAQDFLAWARAQLPMLVITDSYYELLVPFMPKLNYPMIFAHSLLVDESGTITGYRLRVADSKRKALHAFRDLGFRTMAIGDSYNDIGMLEAADQGVLFRPPDNVCRDYPAFPVTHEYPELQRHITDFVRRK